MAKTDVAAQATNLPSASNDFEAYANAGMEHVQASDLLVPRLAILQSLSPQLNKKKSEHIEGAEVGHIADIATGTIFPNGVMFLPVHYAKQWIEWAPRSSGKGLVAIHSDPSILDRCVRNEKNQNVLENGNIINETAQWFGLNLSENNMRCFLPMTSTQLKKSKKWMLLATGEKLKRADGSEFVAPLFYRTYHLTTGEEENTQGSWYSWQINRGVAIHELGDNWRSIMSDAVTFRDALARGEAKADVASMEREERPSHTEVM